MKKINCCFCGSAIDEIQSNNALPIKNGRCCSECNWDIVIPKRLTIN